MEQLHIALIVVIIILLIYRYDIFRSEKTLCSNNNGQCYKISTKFDDQHSAVGELSRINNFNAAFIQYLRDKYVWKGPNYLDNIKMHKITMQLINNYNPDVLRENNPIDTNNTSYVLEKGRSIAFCLREKESGEHKIEDQNMLLFVNLHEISHLAMSFHDPSHSKEFWTTFKLLLEEAIASGLYKPIDWGKTPRQYCGLKVDYNPLYDNQI